MSGKLQGTRDNLIGTIFEWLKIKCTGKLIVRKKLIMKTPSTIVMGIKGKHGKQSMN